MLHLRTYCCFLYLFVNLIAAGQNEATKWYFGQNAGLNFSSNPPGILTGSLITQEGCASIADASGNLLFYTDGSTVYNQTHAIMANGTALNGNASTTQAAVIVKKPGSNTIYYVFTLGAMGAGLYYSEVDMSLAAGMGSVTVKNTFMANSCTEKLTSVRHCNGIDFWVLAHSNQSTTFLAYLVTSSGVNLVPVTSSLGSFHSDARGHMRASPNGKRLALGVYGASVFEVFDFNNSTGVVSNQLILASNVSSPYGVEFSPDGTKVFGTREGPAILYQWDLCAGSNTAIAASMFTVATAPGIQVFALQLAVNGKIYMARFNQSSIGVINNPNVYGIGFNFVDNGQSVSPNTSRLGFPNFMTSAFKPPPPPFTYSLNCQSAYFTAPAVQNNTLCGAAGYSLQGLTWNFGDPGSGSANTSTLSNPMHVYAALGTYTVKLVFNYSCGGGTDTVQQVININQPCISVTSNSITCATLGSATVAATGGVGPFSYTWLPSGQLGTVAGSLSPGTYTVVVYDAGINFTYSATTTFTSPTPLTGSLSNQAALLCNGANNGTATVNNIQGGSGNVNFLWSNGVNSYTTPVADSLSAGVWSVTVTDALTGCTINNLFLVTQPPPLSLSLSASVPSVCAGGSVVLTGINSGGVPGYTYSYTAGPASATHTVSESAGGIYTYTLSSLDSNACLATASIQVSFISNPVIAVADVSVCPGQTATLTASGASSYTWSNGAGTAATTVTPLQNTSYTVSGSLAGCQGSASAAVYIKPLPVLLAGANGPVCSGNSIQLFASGAVSYTWTGPLSFTSGVQNPVITQSGINNSGVYGVSVTAANSCTAAGGVTVLVNPRPTVTAAASTVCVNQPLLLYANGTGTSYVWNGPLMFGSNLQNPVIQQAAPNMSGSYTVLAYGAGNCSNSAVAQASVAPMPVVLFTSNAPVCEGKNLMLTASGGETYSWTGPNGFFSGAQNPVVQAIPVSGGGVYTLNVSSGPCVYTNTLAVIVHALPTPTITGVTSVCENKSFSLAVGAPSQTIVSYSWQGPGFVAGTPVISFSSAGVAQSGVYSASVTNSEGCQSAAATTLTVLLNPQLSAGNVTTCIFSAATLTAAGAASYEWAGPALTVFAGHKTQVYKAMYVAPTVYTVTGTAANSCTSAITLTLFTLPLPVPSLSVLPSGTVCMNEEVVFAGEGGSGYELYGPNHLYFSGSRISLRATSAFFAGTYTMVVSDVNNCKASVNTDLVVSDLPGGSLIGDLEGCVPFCTTFTLSPLGGAALNADWTVDHKKYSGGVVSHCFVLPGEHKIWGSFTDQRTGCRNEQVYYLQARALPRADFSFLPAEPVENTEPVVFTNTSQEAEEASLLWFFMSNSQQSRAQQPAWLFTEAGHYPVALIVKNKWGCVDSVLKTISVSEDFHIYVPNVFTPNDDERNELFMPVCRGVSVFSLQIFNRWGELLFQGNDPGAGWDGTYKGLPCKNDIYIWKIYASSKGGESRSLQGHVTLMR